MKKFLIVGAGFAGSVLARQFAENSDAKITVIEQKDYLGGHCKSERDENTNIMLHCYGPHIFHTSNKIIWDYINRFDELMPFINRVKAKNKKGIFSLPINLSTINSFFNKQFAPKEAEVFIATLGDNSIKEPANFEEQALKFLGKELYDTFFKHYTIKQWGCHPTELPASILKRLPVRFNYDDNYYYDTYQGIPRNGYSFLIKNILNHQNIEVILNTEFNKNTCDDFDYIFYTGPIDKYFNYSEGYLGYRTVYFEKFYDKGDFQGNPLMNYTDDSELFTRITEHKHFAKWESFDDTVLFKEYSKETTPDDTPFYPKRLKTDLDIFERYKTLAELEPKTFFLGRLATYRYLDMHQIVEESINYANYFLHNYKKELTKINKIII